MPAVTYELLQKDATSHARLGRVTTPHGCFDTPAFMPVGTQGTVKGLLPGQVAGTGAQVLLGNTYHLLLRPGSELVAGQGGLHRWMRWEKPILTDSGGFQVFSLGDINRIGDDGVAFKSHLNGEMIELTPERSMQVQHQLGSDIMMAFDDCPPAAAPSEHQLQRAKQFGANVASGEAPHADAGVSRESYAERVRVANERTLRWLGRCAKFHRASGRDELQGLFGIVQGGTDLEMRGKCVEDVCQHDLPGYAIGGVAVGEGPDEIKTVVEHTAPLLPTDRPRYLMGVGYPADLVTAVRAGVDMFDCVLPTRNGRNGFAFRPDGSIRLRNAAHAEDPEPIEDGCDCPACLGGYSRSYLRHLFQAGEMLGPILVSLHNLRLYQRLMLDIRAAIRDDAWSALAARWPAATPGGAGEIPPV